MAVETLIRSMRRRVPWEVASHVFSELDLPVGVGWDRTVTKLLALTDLTPDDEAPLAEALRQHLLCGEKSVRFYNMDGVEKEFLSASLRMAERPEGLMQDAYPALCSEDELLELRTPRPQLVALEELPDGVAAIFGSVRTLEVREPLVLDTLPETAATALSDYDEVVGVRLIRWQAMDVVWIPNDRPYVDVRVDAPRGARQDTSDIAHSYLCSAIRNVAGRDVLGEPLNLFPLIDRIYQDPNEGRVVELAFGTTTASLKHEKMRRRHLNLRAEAYHVAGKAGLGTPIEPFRLAVEWDRRSGGNVVARPEVLFNSTSRHALSGNPLLQDIVVRRCRGIDDFAFVRSRIEAHLEAGGR
jgi:hypothetical protein